MSGLLGVNNVSGVNKMGGIRSEVTGTSTYGVNLTGHTGNTQTNQTLSSPNMLGTNSETESFDIFSDGTSGNASLTNVSNGTTNNPSDPLGGNSGNSSTPTTPSGYNNPTTPTGSNPSGTPNNDFQPTNTNNFGQPTSNTNGGTSSNNGSIQLSGTTGQTGTTNTGSGLNANLGNTGAGATTGSNGYMSIAGRGSNNDGTGATHSYSYESSNTGEVVGYNQLDSTLTSSGMVSASTDTMVEELNNLINELRRIGIQDKDIDRLLNGEITGDELWDEIYNDPDDSRKRAIIEAQTLQALAVDLPELNLNYNSLAEMEADIDELTQQIEEAQMAELYREFSEEKATMLLIDYMSSFGTDIEDAKKECVIAYKYTDENGNVQFVYRAIDLIGLDIDNYEEITYEDMYGDSETYKELLAVVPKREETYRAGFLWLETRTRTVQNLNWNEEQTDFYYKLQEEIANQAYSDTYNIDDSTQALIERKEVLEYLLNNTQEQIDYYIEHIDPYINAPDFDINSKYDSSIGEAAVASISEDVCGYDSYVNVSSKEEMIGLLSEAFNNENSTLSYGYIFTNNNYYYATILSSDEVFMHFLTDWNQLLNEEEIQIFNYIVNTEGAEAAYKYLEEISSTIDQRWYAEKQKNDIQWAQEHPVLASVASVFLTPVEGVVAACYSLNSLITGAELRRTDVYSAGNTYRGAVSAHISEKYSATWAFAYDTLMSMADTAALIGLECVTGGTCTVFLSAATMGSRAYVSALNEALDRGVSPEKAILFGASSAFVETLCESYSVGHLMNLETKLGASTIEFIGKASVGQPSWFEKVLFISASAITQGLCEGEEELCTEILNFFCDQLICGDLSQFSLAIENYINAGYDEDTAILYAFRDKGQDCALAFAGGFCSGIFFGGFHAGKLTYNAVKNDTSVLNFAAIDLAVKNSQETTLAEKTESLVQKLKIATEVAASCVNEFSAVITEKYNQIILGETIDTKVTPSTLTSPTRAKVSPALQSLLTDLENSSKSSAEIKQMILTGVENNEFTLNDLKLALNMLAETKGLDLAGLGSQSEDVAPEMLEAATALAKDIRSKAEKAESQTTDDMVKATFGRSRIAGLDHRLKDTDRISSKIITSHVTGESATLQDAASSIQNSIRYTMVLNPSTYGVDLARTLVDLQKKGYEIEKFNNFWGEDEYKGVNVKLKSKDGTIVELQFHTTESYMIKEGITHQYYEISRNLNATAIEKALADSIQTLYQKDVTIPDGLIDYNYKDQMAEVEKTQEKVQQAAEKIEYTPEDAINFLVDVAGLSIDQATRLSPLFLEGMAAASGKYTEFFKAFREHAAMHTALVTEYAVKIGREIGLAGKDLDIARLSAACHDLGMRGGYYLAGKTKDGQFIFKKIDEGYDVESLPLPYDDSMHLAELARKNHPLNSALTVLTTDIVPESDRSLVALLAMSHSKSTSGIQHFASADEWRASVKKLEAALAQYNNDNNTEYQLDTDGLYAIINNEESFKILQDQALAIRDGDAMSDFARNRDGHMILQTGGYCTFEFYDADIDSYNGEYADTDEHELALLGFRDTLHQDGRSATALDFLNGKQRFSARIHLGESNVRFTSTYTITEQGDRVYRATARPIHDGLAPICTAAAMEERLGEVATYDNCTERQYVIALGSQAKAADGTSTKLLAKYEQLVTEMKTNGINGAILKKFDTVNGQKTITVTGIDESKMCFYTGAVSAKIEFTDGGSTSLSVDGEETHGNRDFRIVLTYADGTVGYLTGALTESSLAKAIKNDDVSKGHFELQLTDSTGKIDLSDRIGAYKGNIIIEVDGKSEKIQETPAANVTAPETNANSNQSIPLTESNIKSSPMEPSFSISTSLDSTAYMIPLKIVQEIINTEEGFNKFMNFFDNNDYFGDVSEDKRQAYILAVGQYMNAMVINKNPITQDSIDRANQILAQSKAITSLAHVQYDDYKTLTRSGPIYYPRQILEKVIFDDNNFDQFVGSLSNLSNIDKYEALAPYHELYNALVDRSCLLSTNTRIKILTLNDIYSHTVNRTRGLLGVFSEYGANQNAVKALAQNPSLNLSLYRDLEAIVKSHFPTMSKLSVKKLLLGINVKGVCSYATLVNELVVNYEGKEDEFRNDFGFDLYRMENGQKVLNTEYIITDLYCYTNKSNPQVLTKGLFGYKIQTDEHQIAMSNSSYKNTSAIQSWLNYRGVNKTWNSRSIYINSDGTTAPLAIQNINDQIALALAQGHTVELDVFVLNKGKFEFGFYPTNNNKRVTSPVLSNSWREGGGHSILVTGVTETGDLIVSSWGNEYIMKWSEISNVKISLFESYLK